MAQRDIVIRLIGDNESLSRSLRQSVGDLDTAGSRMEEFGRRAAAVGDRMSLALTGPLVAAAGGAIKAASDLSEAINVTGLVFGDASDEIAAFADTAATSLGISERAAREATAQIGGLLANLGFAQDETVAWSQDLTVLASDLASAFNTDPAEAIDAIGAALRGETEPIRRFNVMLSDADVRLRAVEMGLADTTAEVDANGKAQVALNLITEQTTAVQGDFANTADGAANSQRILKANIEDLAAELGESLLPIAEDVLSFLNGAVESFSALPEGTQTAIVAFGGFVAAMGPVLSVGGRMVGTLRSMSALLLGSGPWGIALFAATAALGGLAASFVEAQQRAADLRSAIEADTGALGENTRALVINSVQRRDLGEALSTIGVSRGDLVNAILGETDALRRVNTAIDENRQLGIESWEVDRDRQFAAEDVRTALEAETGAIVEQQEALQREALALSEASAEADTFRDRIEAGLAPTTALNMLLADVAPATSAAASGLGEVADAAEVAAFDFGAAQEQMRSSLQSFGGPVDAFADAFEDGEATLDEWIANMDDSTRAQQDFAANMEELATRVSAETFATFQEMAERNPEQAALMAQQAVESTDEELAQLDDTIGRHVDAGIDAMGSRSTQMNAVAEMFGSGAVNTLESALSRGVMGVGDIAWAYTEALRTGVNPILLALDGQSIPAQARILNVPVGVMRNTGGPIPGGGADVDSVPALLTPGEYVVRRRAAQMYGPAAMEAINDGTARVHLNTGGFASLDDVPAVPSVLPARGMVGQPGTQAMGYAREATVEWLKANLAPQLGPGIGWEAMWAALQQAQAMGQIPAVQLFSAFRPGAITATGNASYHGMGRAVDITPSMPIFDWISQNYGPQSREVIYSPANARQWRNGSQRTYGEPTRGDHWDHIHWAMANGAIVRATPDGTRALIGEGGSDEAVIPLDRALAVQVTGFSGSAAQDLAIGALRPDPLANGGFGRPDLTMEQEDEVRRNREALRIEELSAAERLAEVQADIADLEAEGLKYTDEWLDLYQEAEQLSGQIADDIERQAKAQQDAADAAQRTADALGDDLIRLLDERDRLQEQAAAATASYATAVADAQTRAANDITALIGARNDALFGAFGALDQRFSAGWGNLTSQYADELDRRFELFDEWADGVQQLRDRGLSEDVIAQLGLDDPSNLADVRLFVNATDAELQRLTEALSRNQQQTADTAQRESDMLLGALGSAITTVRETLQTTLDGLSADLNVRLTEIGQEMAALGTEQGMSYADALTAALESGLPGVIALAEQYQDALRDAQQAAAAAAALANGGSANAATTYVRPQSDADVWGLRDTTSGAQSLALSYNMTSEQLRSMRPATSAPTTNVRVFVGDRELTDIVGVEVDGRMTRNAYLNDLQGVR